MDILNISIYSLTAAASFGFAVFVYWKNRRSLVNIFFSLYTFSIIGWIITLYLFYNSSQENVLLIGRLNFAATELVAFLGFYFGYFFPSRTFRIKRIWHILLVAWLLVFMALTAATDIIGKDEIITPEGIETVFGDYYFLFIIHFLFFITAIFIFPLIKYKHVSVQQKMQIKYFALGAALSIIFAGTTNILLPFAFKIYKLQVIGPIGLFFFYGLTSYAIIRHQLLDIRVVIQRSLIYSVLVGVIIGFYLVLVFVLGFIFQQSTDMAIMLAAGLATLTGIFGAPPLEKWFRHATDRFFYKDKYDYTQAVYELSGVLNRFIEIRMIVSELLNKLNGFLKVEHIALIMLDKDLVYHSDGRTEKYSQKISPEIRQAIEQEADYVLLHSQIPGRLKEAGRRSGRGLVLALELAQKQGEKYNIAVTAAILLEKRLVGFLSLGPKLSGDAFSSEDVSLLKTITNQAAVALEKARLYEQVKEYSERLEEKVKERTAHIEALQEEQKQMILEISHGLQTPLTIIKAELEYMKEEVKDQSKIASLEKSIDRTSRFIYDMLRLSNLEAKEKEFEPKEFDLSRSMKDLVESFRIITEEKKILIDARIEEGVLYNGDQTDIEEAVTNLVSNSVKYMKSGRDKKIRISLGRPDQKRIEIAVEDNGIGMKAEDAKKLFTRFHRIRDQAHANKKGTGLGLAITRQIVKMHGGEIKVKSAPDKGAKFTITLPQK